MAGKRRRRHHHRSRNGCRSCKERHMRCDEGKPFCRNCLRNGGDCGYAGIEDVGAFHLQQLPIVESEISSGSLHTANLNQQSNFLPSHPTRSNMLNTFCEVSPSPIVQSPLTSGFDFEIMEPFNSLPIVMSREAHMLLDHCKFNLPHQLLKHSNRIEEHCQPIIELRNFADDRLQTIIIVYFFESLSEGLQEVKCSLGQSQTELYSAPH